MAERNQVLKCETDGLIADGISYKAFLAPGMAPAARFMVEASKVTARAYCLGAVSIGSDIQEIHTKDRVSEITQMGIETYLGNQIE
jgi:hypothetical protein